MTTEIYKNLVCVHSLKTINYFQSKVDGEETKRKDTVSMKSGGFDITHFTWNDDSENKLNKITFGGSFCDTPQKKECHAFKFEHFFQQVWVLIRWQALIFSRNYLKLITNLLLPTLCVLFYGFSVGHEMNEINLGIGKYMSRMRGRSIDLMSLNFLVYCGQESLRNNTMETPSISAWENRISSKYLTKKRYDVK